MVLKNKPILSILSTLVIATFLWSQIVFALELPDHPLQNNITFQQSQQKNLPINLHKLFQKQLSRLQIHSLREKIKPTLKYCLIAIYAKPNPQNQIQNYTQTGQYDRLGRVDEKYGTYDGKSYKWKAISYDELGRPTAYKEKIGKVSYRHYDIIYNELGDVSYEKIKVTAKSGVGPFKSKTKVLTEYWYGYDEYGQHEKIKEHEIYRKTSTNPLGQIIKAIVGIALAFIPGLNFIGYAALMAVTNFAFSILSGADFKQALIGAAIAFAASVLARGLSGVMAGGTFAGALTTGIGSPLNWGAMDWIMRGISLIDSLVASQDGKSLMQKLFGKNADIIFGILTAIAGFLEGGVGITGPPELQARLQAVLFQQLVSRLIVTAITEILKRNANPYIAQFFSQFLSEFVSSYFSFKMQDVKNNYWDEQGFQLVKDEVTGEYYLVEKNPISNRTILNEDGSLNRIEILNEYGNAEYSLTPSEKIEGGLEYRDSQGNFLYTTAINPHGGIDYYDINGVKRLSLYSTGWTEVFDSVGKSYALIPPNAEIVWNTDGTIKESFIKYDNYTEYYNKDGSPNGRIVDGYTALRRGDEIVGQTRQISEDTYIYRDSSGRFANIITITSDGVCQDDGRQTTFYNNANIREWTRLNTEHSDIFYFDSSGLNITKVLSTQLDESGLVKGFTITDLATGNFRQYNSNGELQAYYLARKDAEGNIYGYKGVDTQGTQIILGRDGTIHSTLTKDGKYIAYIDGEIYRVLRRNSVAILDQGVLDRDPKTGKFTLYDDLGTKITDNPVILAARLNFSLLTLPANIRDKIWSDAKDLLIQIKELTIQKELEGQIPSRWELFIDELKQHFTLPEGVSLAGMGMAGTVVAGEPTQLTKILVGAAILGYGIVITSQSAWRANSRYKNLISGFEASRVFSRGEVLEPTKPIEWQEGVTPSEPIPLVEGFPVTEPIQWQEGVPATQHLPITEGLPAHQKSPDDFIMKAVSTISVETPYGVARQSTSKEALDVLSKVQEGVPVYRSGNFPKSKATEGQFWSIDNPLEPGYANRVGGANIDDTTPDFVIKGRIKPEANYITREAPPVGNNIGGGIEIVVEENGVEIDNFYMPNK